MIQINSLIKSKFDQEGDIYSFKAPSHKIIINYRGKMSNFTVEKPDKKWSSESSNPSELQSNRSKWNLVPPYKIKREDTV